MGLMFDLAVMAIAVVVVGSLAVLAWTLGVSSVRAVARGRASAADSRRSVAEHEARLVRSAARANEAVAAVSRRLAARTGPGLARQGRTTLAGDEPDE